jgi:hypothetical protein
MVLRRVWARAQATRGRGESYGDPRLAKAWAMMLLGFAGLGFVGYRRIRKAVSIAA